METFPFSDEFGRLLLQIFQLLRLIWATNPWGRNFLGTPMEACIVIGPTQKPANRRGRVLFIDAVNEITRERSMSFLKPEHQEWIEQAFAVFENIPEFAQVANVEEIATQGYSLSIPWYVRGNGAVRENQASYETNSLGQLWTEWEQEGRVFWQEMDALVAMLDDMEAESRSTSLSD